MASFGYGKILSMVGSITQAIGSKATAELSADQIRLQRYMTHINENFVDMATKLRKTEIDQEREAFIGTQRAIAARSGVTFDGSPAEAVIETEKNFAKEKIATDIEARIQKLQLSIERGSLELQEDQTRKAGTLSLIGGLLQAGSKGASK